MKKGDVVMVYEDPLTREKPEGKAMLLEHFKDGAQPENLQCWNVRFLEDSFEALRWIKANGKEE